MGYFNNTMIIICFISLSMEVTRVSCFSPNRKYSNQIPSRFYFQAGLFLTGDLSLTETVEDTHKKYAYIILHAIYVNLDRWSSYINEI